MAYHAPRLGALTDLYVRELITAAAPKLPYFAIRTQVRAERQVKERLLAQGLDPLQLKFIPGYVFARFHPAQRMRISALAGVHSIVGFAAQPAPVDDEELSALVRVADARLAVGPAPYPAHGIPCRMSSGPLEGVRGIIMSKSEEAMVVLSLTLLQKSVAVRVEQDWIGSFLPSL